MAEYPIDLDANMKPLVSGTTNSLKFQVIGNEKQGAHWVTSIDNQKIWIESLIVRLDHDGKWEAPLSYRSEFSSHKGWATHFQCFKADGDVVAVPNFKVQFQISDTVLQPSITYPESTDLKARFAEIVSCRLNVEVEHPGD